MRLICLLILGVLPFRCLALKAGTAVQRAPVRSEVMINPFQDQRDGARAGAKVFARECASCHGHQREGRVGPPLASREIKSSQPGRLFWVLRNGSIRRGMPSFAHLPEQQRWQIITFLQQEP